MKPIFLLDIFVRGTRFNTKRGDIERYLELQSNHTAPVTFELEPSNTFDPHAVIVFAHFEDTAGTVHRVRIGYIPKGLYLVKNLLHQNANLRASLCHIDLTSWNSDPFAIRLELLVPRVEQPEPFATA